MEMCVSYLAASEMLSIVENLNDAGVVGAVGAGKEVEKGSDEGKEVFFRKIWINGL